MSAGEVVMGIVSIICLTFIIVVCIACKYSEELEEKVRRSEDGKKDKSNESR